MACMKTLKGTFVKKLYARVLAACAFLAVAFSAFAQSELTFNAGVESDYRYRGISQSHRDPSVFGGVDYFTSGGFYLGSAAHTLKKLDDMKLNSDSQTELDLYGGYKFPAGPFMFDVGVLRYHYFATHSANTTEFYTSASVVGSTLKYSRSMTDLFGIAGSKGSEYLELSADFALPMAGLKLTPHVGHAKVAGMGAADYTDYSLTLAKDFGRGFTGSLAYVGTDADRALYTSPANGKFLGDKGVVVGVKYSF